MRKIMPFFIALMVLLLSFAAFADSSVNKESTSTLALVSGKILILPPFPGLVRVDGLYPEIDAHFLTSEKLKAHTAIFAPSEEIWVEHHRIRLDGGEPERKTGTFCVYADNDRHTGDNVQKAVDIFSSFASKKSPAFGDIPDSGFWCYGASNPKTQGIIIFAYTILDEQIIIFQFSVAQDFSKVTPAWIESQEQRILDWVLLLRKVNHDLIHQ